MNVYKLTNEQAQQIEGKHIDNDTIIMPSKDNDGNYYVAQSLKESLSAEILIEWGVISWWNTLPLIPYNPLISNI